MMIAMMMLMSKWIFENRPVLVRPGRYRLYRCHPTPIGTTILPRPPTRKPLVSLANELPPIPDTASGGRGGASSWGRIAFSPRTGRIVANGGFTASRRPFPRGVSSANFKTTFPDYIKYTNIHTIFERKTNAAFKINISEEKSRQVFSKRGKLVNKRISKISVRIEKELKLHEIA